MKIELLNAEGEAVAVLVNVKDEAEIAVHLPHYPGVVSWREVDPAIVAAEEAAEEQNRQDERELARKLKKAFFYLINELRRLDGKPPITIDQFRTMIQNL